MTDEYPRRGVRGRLLLSGLFAALFSIALVALVTSQLLLMSVLDGDRARRAAEQIAESRFAESLIEDTVERAVAPVAGESIAQQAAATASADPAVADVIADALVATHRQIVDADPPDVQVDGNVTVGAAIVRSVLDTAAANGVDPASLGLGDVSADVESFDAAQIARQAGLPEVVPTDPPRLGLRQAAETTRAIALVGMLVCATGAVLIHPRSGRSLRGLGVTVAAVTGLWLAVLVVAGFVIDAVSSTLFGEMLDTVWSDAVPSMLLLVGAGVVIGVGLVLAGIALDGFTRRG